MTLESVRNAEPALYLPLNEVDRAQELIEKAKSIADLMGHCEVTELADSSLAGASWAIQGLLDEVNKIVGLRSPK